MRKTTLLLIAALALVAAPAAHAQVPNPGAVPDPGSTGWTYASTLEEYQSWPMAKKIEIYRQVVADPFYTKWSRTKLSDEQSLDPSLGGYDPYLRWLPLSPYDMLNIDMLVKHYEVAIPRLTDLLYKRWVHLHFDRQPGEDTAGQEPTPTPSAASTTVGRQAAPAVTVGQNRNSAHLTNPGPEKYDGEVQIVVNPNNPNEIVSMSNTWDNMGDTTNCGGYGSQAIFYSSDGGDTWGYTCAPTGARYGLLRSGSSCQSLEAGSDPALYWDDQGNVYANYMAICYSSSGSVAGDAIVVAKSTDGGASWTPHGILQDSYNNDQFEDKNFYIIDNNPTSPYFRRHYSCWDRNNNELVKYSTDEGVNWTEVGLPSTGHLNLGCEMAVQKNGTLHLIYDDLTCTSSCTGEEMYYTRSTDGGATWLTPPVSIQNFTSVISFGSDSTPGPQNQRGINPFGAIDVDNSGGACDGYLYAAFTNAPSGGTSTANIYVRRSTDNGNTWGAPVQVNDDSTSRIQFHPFLVVDQSSGDVFVAWHDARNDPNNRAVDFYVARSTDCGQTFEANVQASQPSSEFNNSSISYTDENSSDNTGYNPNQFGEYMGLDVHNGVAYLGWTDTRHFFPSFTTNSQKENIGFTKVTYCYATAPASLSAAANGSNRIDLSWSSATGATEYRIYRSTHSGWGYSQIGTVTAPTTSYSDTDVQGGVTYYYVVSTYTTCASAYSVEASATGEGPCDQPPTFAGLASVSPSGASSCALDLTWSAATAHCGGPVTYSVYRSTTTGFTPDLSNRIAAGLEATSYTDASAVSEATAYYYVVRANDEANGQEESNTVEKSGTPAGPDVDGTWSAGAEPSDPSLSSNGFWTISSARVHSGNKSYFSGYRNNLCEYLRTPELALTAGQASTLTYWTAYSIENQYDGGVVEVSNDGGASWSVLTPTPGYPSRFRYTGNACGYGNRTCYGGTNLSFTQYTVSLSSYNGQDVMVRWNFSTDSGVTQEGWYVDDISISHVQVPGTCSSTPSDPLYLTVRSTDGQDKLEWVNPSAPYSSTKICRSTTAYPDPSACTPVTSRVGTVGAYDSWTDTGLTNTTKYYYTAFVDGGTSAYSGGREAWGRPFATSGKVKWAYHTAASSLAPPGVYPGALGTGAAYAVSNDRILHSMNTTSVGGDWPRTAPFAWEPMAMNGPAQARPGVIPTTVVPGANMVTFLGSEDGHVYAVDTENGTTLWQSAQLGTTLTGAPSGILTAYGGSYNLLFVGTRNATSDNAIYALDPSDGSTKWSYDNGGGSGGIGIISSDVAVDQSTNRLYFASRARGGGSSNTLWCIDFTDTGASFRWAVALGDIDGAPVLYQGRLYVGTNDGHVYAIDAVSGATVWTETLTTGDGPVKGFVSPQASPTPPRRLYFATTTEVWALSDNGGSASVAWGPIAISGPSIPLAPYGGSKVYVGSSDGRLYQLDAASGSVDTSVQLGDGTGAIGSPTYDTVNNIAYVGSEAGVVYAVSLPLN